MTPPSNKVDMAEMNRAIDKVLAIPARPKPDKQRRTQRKADRPPPARSGKATKQPPGR